MELEKQYVHRNETIATAFYQTTVDDDYNIPDYRPDIMKIVKCKGKFINEEIKVGSQCVYLQGKLCFSVLYLGENRSGQVSSLHGEIPIREKINMDGVEEFDPVYVTSNVKDMNISVINSRKINVHGIVDMMLQSHKMTDILLPTASGMEDRAYQIKKCSKEVLQLVENKKDVVRMRQEITLPQDKPNATQLLWSETLLWGMETGMHGDVLEVKGNASISVLYQGTDETPFEWYETTLPLEGMMESARGKEGDHFEAHILSVNPIVDIKEDMDGEMRSVSLDVTMEMELSIWKDETIEMLEDMYSLKKELHLQKQTKDLEHLLVKNYGRCRVSGEMALDEMEEAMYLCSTEGRVQIDDIEIEENAVKVIGKLLVEILYLTRDDAIPLCSGKGVFPFEQELETKGITKDAILHFEEGVGALTVSLSDSHSATVKGEVQLNLMVFEIEQTEIIQDVLEEDRDEEKLQQAPGMIGYIVQQGDCLWDIAKENYTTVEDLMKSNGLTEEQLIPSQKILIVKQVMQK